MFDCVILLAGKGKRSGLPYNKVLHEIGGKPLFRYSLEKFLESPSCRKAVLVCEQQETAVVRELVRDLERVEFARGGKERQDSVKAGMELCETDVVLIHDGARPFITVREIEEVYRAALANKAAVLAVRPKDTIVEAGKGYRTIDRESLWRILTPQGMWRELYLEAVRQAEAESHYGTDDVGLLAKYLGIRPEIVQGSDLNIKVTTREDLLFSEFIIRREK